MSEIMRLPKLSQLSDPAHHFLYQHDQDELHCSNPRAFSHRMYIARFKKVLEVVDKCKECFRRSLNEIKILDIGCAQGNFSLTLSEQGFQVFAIDLQFPFLTYMKLKYDWGRLYYINANLEYLPFRKKFDIIILGEIIEHIAYPDNLLNNLKNLISSQGSLILTTPNGDRLFKKMPTFLQIKDRLSLVSKQFQPDADGHLYVFTRRELITEIKKAGLRVIQHEYFGTPFITGGMKLRFLIKYLPIRFTNFMEKMLTAFTAVGRLFAEEQMVIAKLSTE